MTAHAHLAIIQQFRTTLTGLTTTGSNVYNNTHTARNAGNIPCLIIVPDAEPIGVSSRGSGTYVTLSRGLVMNVTVIAISEAQRADIAYEAEVAVVTGPKEFRNRIINVDYDSDLRGDTPIWVLEQQYILEYRTTEDRPDVAV